VGLRRLGVGCGGGGDVPSGGDSGFARDHQAVVDRHPGDFAGALQIDGDEAAAGRAGGRGLGHFRLGVLQLLLHRLGLLHEGVEVFHGF